MTVSGKSGRRVKDSKHNFVVQPKNDLIPMSRSIFSRKQSVNSRSPLVGSNVLETLSVHGGMNLPEIRNL
jgi:hypothetical protein